jgi:hypothetical protein
MYIYLSLFLCKNVDENVIAAQGTRLIHIVSVSILLSQYKCIWVFRNFPVPALDIFEEVYFQQLIVSVSTDCLIFFV